MPERTLRAGIGARMRDEAGTVLVLVPAGLLVILLLGTMAFDLSLAYAGERRIADLAAAWANDAVAHVDERDLYGSAALVGINQPGAVASVEAARAELVDGGLTILEVQVTFPDPSSVRVRVVAEVPLLFLDAVPGMRARRVDAESLVTLVVSK